jgi:hypothetical protein
VVLNVTVVLLSTPTCPQRNIAEFSSEETQFERGACVDYHDNKLWMFLIPPGKFQELTLKIPSFIATSSAM